jgi:hypothetical protein
MRQTMRCSVQDRKHILPTPAISCLLIVFWACATSTNAVADNNRLAIPSDGPALQSELAHEQLTVRELMHLDMDQALQQARNARRGKSYSTDLGNDPVRVSSPSGPPTLMALYGLGKTKFAQVQFGTASLLFMQGRSAPIGMKAALAPYRLKDIQGECITLENQAGESTLCLSLPAWER